MITIALIPNFTPSGHACYNYSGAKSNLLEMVKKFYFESPEFFEEYAEKIIQK